MITTTAQPATEPAARVAIPVDGQTVCLHGYEFIASNVRIVPNPNTPGGGMCVRFTGTCTAAAVNDSIRHTSFNGGTYGWRV